MKPPAHYNPPPMFGLRRPFQYGLREVATGYLLGSTGSPHLYDDLLIAFVAHTMTAYELGVSGHAIEIVRVYSHPHRRVDPGPTPVMSTRDALAVAQGELSEDAARRRYRQERSVP